MTVINTNVSALRAQNASRMASNDLQTAMTRLSSGKRINSASDDAAGLAISSSMTSQIKGMSQAIRNANDGISLAQTADGALDEVSNMLQRVRELAVQSASGTYSDDDRTNMNAEVTQLTSQMTDVLNNTKFNGVSTFDFVAGSTPTASAKVTIQVGSGSTDTVDLQKAFVSSDNISSTKLDVSDATKAGTTLTSVDAALKDVNTARANLGAGESRLNSVVNNLTNNVNNLSDARSRIQDTDFSAETTNLAKAQILAQASTAMLAQANQSQQGVMKLIQ